MLKFSLSLYWARVCLSRPPRALLAHRALCGTSEEVLLLWGRTVTRCRTQSVASREEGGFRHPAPCQAWICSELPAWPDQMQPNSPCWATLPSVLVCVPGAKTAGTLLEQKSAGLGVGRASGLNPASNQPRDWDMVTGPLWSAVSLETGWRAFPKPLGPASSSLTSHFLLHAPVWLKRFCF